MMSLRWLSSMVGGRAVKSVRQKVAPQAQRTLLTEIDADAVAIRRMLLRDLVWDDAPADAAESGTAKQTVIARVDASNQPALDAWLNATGESSSPLDVRTDWIFFPATPEAVAIAVAKDAASGAPRFRFNLRLPADAYRRHLEALARIGSLGLTTVPLQIDERRRLLSPCLFVQVQQAPLRAFLREIPAVPVV